MPPGRRAAATHSRWLRAACFAEQMAKGVDRAEGGVHRRGEAEIGHVGLEHPCPKAPPRQPPPQIVQAAADSDRSPSSDSRGRPVPPPAAPCRRPAPTAGGLEGAILAAGRLDEISLPPRVRAEGKIVIARVVVPVDLEELLLRHLARRQTGLVGQALQESLRHHVLLRRKS